MGRLRIVVGGLIGRAPVGGWHYLQYIAGLAGLGHDVYYHEDTWCWPYHPVKRTYTDDPSYSVEYLSRFFESFAPNVRDRWHYRHLNSESHGMEHSRFVEVARTADIFLNIGGACLFPDELSPNCVKVFVDTDPGYNQIVMSEKFNWSENVERWCSSVEAHDRHFTYAGNIDGSDCTVPRLQFAWETTRPPVVMDLWRPIAEAPAGRDAAWTTIMTWNPFKGRLVYRGREYRGKAPEFEKLIDLPMASKSPLKIAVGGVSASAMEQLASHGWQVVDGPDATITPQKYRDFIRDSKGELSCAKEVYVAMRTGWFSERTVCYLASGRPAVVQDTGFGSELPVGEGLLVFDDAAGARAAMDAVESDYPRHSRAARDVAELFAADKVLTRLIERIAATSVHTGQE